MKLTRKYKKRGGGSGMSSREQNKIEELKNEIEVLKKEIKDKEAQLSSMDNDYKKNILDGEYSRYDIEKYLMITNKNGPTSTPRNHLIGEINSLKRRLKNKEDTLNELNTKGGKRKTRRRNRRKNGGGPTSSKVGSNTRSNKDCKTIKKRVKEEIEEVKAALEPQFNMAEKVNKETLDDGYTSDDLNDYFTYRGIKLDKGMERRLIELYNMKIELEEQCPDEKKGEDKRKTRRRNKKGKK